ncbi:MAG: M24 family metallopeptidase [Bacillota bacterium]
MTRLEESNMKAGLLTAEIKNRGYDAVVIKKQPNFSWITSGGRGFIGLSSENACAYIVVTPERIYLASNNIESPRLLKEELPEGFADSITLEWHEDGNMGAMLKKIFGNIADDTDMDDWFKAARTNLNPNEIQRYRTLGNNVADVLETVCFSLRPGLTEFEIAGLISQKLWSRGIEPITLLVAADERSHYFRHYVPTGNRVNSGVIVSLCARSGGLVVSATRSVAFKKGFAQGYDKLLNVEQAALEATLEGGTLGDVISKIISAYKENGFSDEWKNHHQGGLTGYLAREIRANPSCQVAVQANQAYAWNPSAIGAKCEDTVIRLDGRLEFITPVSANWPKLNRGKWIRPDVLKAY